MHNKVAIVTGAASGIGAATALRLAKAGYCQALVDVNGDQNASHAAELRGDGHEARAFTFDVRDEQGWSDVVEACVERWGRLDLIFSNAGIIRDARVFKMTTTDWDDVVDICLKATWLAARAAFPVMMEQRFGRIVATSSSSYRGNFGQSNYAAAKGGLISLVKTLGIEGAKYGITANAIAPGTIATPGQLAMEEQWLEKYLSGIPMGRFGEPEEVASLVEYLASPDAGYITGQLINVCGGATLGAG